MKIALLRRQFAATGGAELYLQRLLKALAEAGHELHLYAESWEGDAAGVQVHALAAGGSRAVRAWRYAEAARAAVAAERFDCIFSLERTLQQDVYRAGDGLHRVWLARRREYAAWWKRPFVGLGAFHRNLLRLEAQTFSPACTRRIIVNSEMVRREIAAHFSFPPDRIHLVRNGVDVARFRSGHRAEARARWGVGEREFLLLFAGSGWERKGLRFLLEAFALAQASRSGPGQSTNLKLLVAGKGTPPAAAPGVIFAGPVKDMENAMAAADLLVFPPIYEPSSNVVVEALAAGLPVVTTAQNGAAEILREGQTGTVLSSPRDVAGMARAIEFWAGKGLRVSTETAALSLERNVAETMAVLELAARERNA